MATVIVIIIIVAIVGWIFVKSDEMSGLGRNVKMGGMRHPHGKLVGVRATDALPDVEPFAKRFAGTFPIITSIMLLVALIALNCIDASLFGVPTSEMALMLSNTGITALIIVVEATFRAPEGKKTFWTFIYALVGAVALGLVVWAVLAAISGGTVNYIAYSVCTIAAYAFGSSLTVALLPTTVAFERRFEDGAKRSITVSTRSAAYAAYVAMMDETSKED